MCIVVFELPDEPLDGDPVGEFDLMRRWMVRTNPLGERARVVKAEALSEFSHQVTSALDAVSTSSVEPLERFESR